MTHRVASTAEPLEARHLAGAKALSNFATNVIGIGISKLDSHKRYIKHIKNRKGIKVFTEVCSSTQAPT
jgi:hypothetical protein